MSATPRAGFDRAAVPVSDAPMVDYKRIFDSAPALLLLLANDARFSILGATDSYLRATHTVRQEIVGRGLFEVFPDNPDEPGATGTTNLRASLERVVAGRAPDVMAVQKYDLRRPDSEGGGFEVRYWSPVNAPVLSDSGEIAYIVHRVEDVTELVLSKQAAASDTESMRLEVLLRSRELDEANRRLREANAQYQAIYDQGLFAGRLALDGTVIDVNRASVEGCGFVRAETIGRPFWDCGWWNRDPKVQAWVRAAVMRAVGGETFRGDSPYFLGDGTERVVDFACMPIKDAQGNVVMVVPTGMDITERMQGEQNRRAYEEQRQRAEALAELDGAKTAFFSNVSHEFRTPLTLMLGPLEELMAEPSLTPMQRVATETAHRNGLRLLKLVNTLLEFSRIEAGRAQASYMSTDLAALTADLASAFRAAMEKAGLAFTVDCPPLSESAWVDRGMWEKIVLNLLSNAFKFTFEGGVALRLKAADGAFELTVQDSGTGIPAAELPHMFERFRRVEGAPSRTHEGTGIGLALVQDLVRLHGGSVGVESQLGRGSTFTVRIPIGHAHLPADRLGAASPLESTAIARETFVDEALRWLPTEASQPPAPDGTRRSRVLVADDNADMRDYLRRILATRYEVETVADGAAALAAARARPPDLLLADVMMPKLDGLGLARARHAEPALKEIPLILLSARAGEAFRIEGLEAGADDYVEKPFTANELLARVSSRLELTRLSHDAQAALREREERLRAVIETTPECVKLVRADGTVLQMNPSGLDMVGASRAEDVIGRCVYDLVVPEHREMVRAFNERICRGERGTLEFDIIGSGGVRRNVDSHAAPLKMPDGSTVQLALTRDITARRSAEAALRESDRRKDEFIATLSHELRNPLAPLRNALMLLRQGRRPEPSPAKVAALHDMMERQVNHLVRLVDDLLEMSRISRGALELRRERVELGSIVRNAVETSEPLIREGGHRLEVELPRDLVWLEGDPVRLAQIFSNLLNNAARFTSHGGHITIAATALEGEARIAVRDTGRGFSPQAAASLFQMFSKSERSSGLGIGLALARRLAELHGGTITGHSEGEGRGAEFVVRFPIVTGEAPVITAPQSGTAALVARRVLVADDNRDSAESLADLLRDLGNVVELAFDGAEAVEVARIFRPDLALLDIGMPKMDGYEAAQRIRGEAGTRPLTLIALTGWGQDDDRRRAREAGFDAHLVKPAEIESLRALLE